MYSADTIKRAKIVKNTVIQILQLEILDILHTAVVVANILKYSAKADGGPRSLCLRMLDPVAWPPSTCRVFIPDFLKRGNGQ